MKLKTYVLAVSMALVLTVLVYHPVVKGGFYIDDKYHVGENPYIRDLSHFREYFLNPNTVISVKLNDPSYRPMLTLWWAILYSIFGLDPAYFHWAGLGLHALNSVLVFLLACKLLESSRSEDGQSRTALPTTSRSAAAFLSSAAFLLHTANVEPVSWIAAQGTLLGFAFSLAAVLVGIHRKGYISAAITGLLLLCATLSYESALGLPIFYLAILIVYGGVGALKEHSKSLVAIALAVIFSVALRAVEVGQWRFFPIWGKSLPYHISVAAYSMLLSLRVTLFPNVPKADYVPYLWSSVFSPKAILCLIAAAAIGVSLAVGLRRRGRWTIPLAGWFAFYLPASGLIPNSIIFGDRLIYIPNIGIAIALGMIVDKLGRVAAIFCAIAALSLGLLSYGRAKIWTHPMNLFPITLKSYPALVRMGPGEGSDYRIGQIKARLLTYDGVRNITNGNLQFALNELTEAAVADPNSFDARLNLGMALSETGRLKEAVEQYRAGTLLEALTPELESNIHDNLGNTLTSMGKYEEAISEYRFALSRNPTSSTTHSNLATALIEAGRYEEAEAELITALRLRPYSEPVIINLASLYIRTGRARDAVAILEKAAEARPNSIIIFKNLATVYLKAGIKDKANQALNKFLQMYPAARGTPFHEEFLRELRYQ